MRYLFANCEIDTTRHEFYVGAESRSRHGHFPTPHYEQAWEEERRPFLIY